ncbi:MAG TPA: alpha-ketoacid dehydrogenase subunit beta [Herpetosiphonaceae bacterium]|jgi:pyruvate dehydrogenase E1 component beta subunit|nr:alpha-ketoacid dehydrogenase subunit beta [Herpetosiphonaceae bacterium]
MAVLTVRQALQQALREQLEDPRVFIIGEDIGYYGSTYGVTAGFLEEYGTERIRDSPIAEAGIIGVGIGSAMLGMRPICEIMSVNFSLLAFDQIINHAAKIHYMFGGQIQVPLVLRTTNGWRNLSATHSQTFDSMFAYVPGLKVVAPATPADMKGLFTASMEDPDPVIFIEHTLMYGVRGEVPDGHYTVPLGESAVHREGTDVTIVTYSRPVHLCAEVAETLSKEEGIECEIIDLRTIRPMDMSKALESFRKTGRAVVVTEEWESHGVQAEIAARLYQHDFDYLDAPIERVGYKELPFPYSTDLENQVVVTPERIAEAIHKVLA